MRFPRHTTRNPTGEMPFFDHLEELRWRILWSLLALVIGTGIGFYAALQFDMLSILKQPVDRFTDGAQLISLSVSSPFMITFHIAFITGAVLAAPIIAYQAWAFFGPALTSREKRSIVPALYLGAVLFCLGVALAYVYVLPMTLQFFGTFQSESLKWMLTAEGYFGFVFRLLIAFGLMFELPVVVLVLATLGLITSKFLASKRRYAIAVMAVLAAFITPGDALNVTIFMMLPLILLYELGILLARLVERSRAREARDALAEAQ